MVTHFNINNSITQIIATLLSISICYFHVLLFKNPSRYAVSILLFILTCSSAPGYDFSKMVIDFNLVKEFYGL
jgi:hypothetical protein